MQCTHHLTLVEPTRLVDGAREFEDDSMRRELSWTEDDLDRSDIVCDSDTVVISIESHLSTHIASAKATKKRKKEKSKTFFVAHFRFFQMRRQREEIFVWFHVILLFFPSVISPLILSQCQQLRRYSVFSNNKDDDDAMRTKRRRQAAKRRILSRPNRTKPVAQNFSFFFFCILCMMFRHYLVWSILALCATLYMDGNLHVHATVHSQVSRI